MKDISRALFGDAEPAKDVASLRLGEVVREYIKFYAEGGTVGGRHHGFAHDDFHAFPEQNVVAQRHLAMRHGEDEAVPYKERAPKVKLHKDMDTMRLELTRKK
jgi:hypothetical protein